MRYEIREARPADLAAVQDVIAYQPWATSLGFRPKPRDANYADLIEAGRVYVAGHGDVDGVAVFVDEEDRLLVENVGVRSRLQGRASAARCSPSPNSRRAGIGSLAGGRLNGNLSGCCGLPSCGLRHGV